MTVGATHLDHIFQPLDYVVSIVPVGSSARISGGSLTIARAIANRPALHLSGYWSAPELNASRSHGFHLFRHSSASIVRALTSDLKLAQEILGHVTIDTTVDIYTYVG